MKRSFKDRIVSLGLSYQKEVAFLFIINFLILIGAAAVYLFLFQKILVVIIGAAILLATNYLFISRYSMIEKNIQKEHLDELISLLSYFELFISNGNNVYNSFKLLIPYSSMFMEDAITSLLNQIDSDKTVGPFITFASKFDNHIVESLMLSIYQMVDNGENSGQFNEFSVLFSTISKEHHDRVIEQKKNKLDTLDSLPLFGAGAITIVLAMSILTIVGDLIDVL